MGKVFNLRNGMILLSTEAPGGIYNSAQLKKIATLCDNDTAIVKVTEDQRLALFVEKTQAKTIAKELRALGLGIRHYQDGLHQPTACIGELCQSHMQDALGSAMELTQQISHINLASPLKIGINGCGQCCVPSHTLDISVVGDQAGYRLSLGGKSSQIPEIATYVAEGVPAEKLGSLLKAVILKFKETAQPGESLQDLLERVGISAFVEVLAPYSQDAANPEGLPADDFSSNNEQHDPLAEEDDQLADQGDMSFDEIESGQPLDDINPSDEIEEDSQMNSDVLIDDPSISFSFEDDDMSVESSDVDFDSAEMDQDLSPPELDDVPDFDQASTEFDSEESDIQDSMSYEEDIADDSVVNEADEMEFEKKIENDIAESQDLEELEDPLEDRMQALEAVESGQEVLADLSPDNDPLSTVDMDDSSLPDFDAPPSEDFQAQESAKEVQPTTVTAATDPFGSFQGVDFTASSEVRLTFSSGMSILLDGQMLSTREPKSLNFGGKIIKISPKSGGVDVNIDGIALFIPVKTAA